MLLPLPSQAQWPGQATWLINNNGLYSMLICTVRVSPPAGGAAALCTRFHACSRPEARDWHLKACIPAAAAGHYFPTFAAAQHAQGKLASFLGCTSTAEHTPQGCATPALVCLHQPYLISTIAAPPHANVVQLEVVGAVGSLIVWVLAIVILVKSCSNGSHSWAGGPAPVQGQSLQPGMPAVAADAYDDGAL